MKEGAVTKLLDRYGQTVILQKDGGEQIGKAILQPLREKGTEQEMPAAVGLCRGDRFLYLGQAELTLEAGTDMRVLPCGAALILTKYGLCAAVRTA